MATVHRYRPVGSALELFNCRADEVVLSGAAGTGKSRACLEKVHGMMLANPGAKALAVRKTAVSLTSTGLETFRKIVAKEAIDSGELTWYGGSRQEAASYRYGNGSVMVVGGLDKATRIMSSEYDVIFVQEATELVLDDWESLTTRLRNGFISFQQLMADCNPGAPQHWLNQRCTSGKTIQINCRHEDNPKLYDTETSVWTTEGLAYLAKLEALTGVRYLRLRRGIWAAAEGLVYENFDPAIHFHNPIGMPPAHWTRYLVVDFGYRNPFCCQWWAQDRDGRLYMYREIYMTGRLVEDHAKQILEVVKRGDGHRSDVWPPRQVICDHDAEDRATLERHLSLSTDAATKNVSEGIQAFESRLKVRGDGKPGLYLCRDAVVERDPVLVEAKKPTCTAEEILEYIWDPSTAGAAAGTPKETPLKQNDHGMDCGRYLVAEVDLVGRPRVRFFS